MTPAAAPIRLASEASEPAAADGSREVDLARIERAVREILLAVGEDPKREGLRDTPRRVARAYRDLLRGLGDDPARHLGRVFEHDSAGDDLVIVRGIEFASVCEHHLLPFLGRAHVAYLPDRGKVVGLSKIARAVDVLARRPQLQERLAAQIADAIAGHLGARGVAVMVESEHLCMKIRGVGKQHADMVTTAVRGELARNAALRAEAHALIRAGR
ncbi:GTP cyclohydrolase I FolE [Candidatus Binatia bacterium]|jgi:GTP cyclohydrolase I|nr:GTP cyclohydrolase I FolE [Candidatus Binatia bacterium]